MFQFKIIYEQKSGIRATRLIMAKSESDAQSKFMQMSSGLGYKIILVTRV